MIDPTLRERFDAPPSEYGPTPLWWWSGGTVTEEGISEQLQRFADGGILNVVLMNLAPKGPTYGAMPDDPEWFSERWWELFAFTCEVAAERGIALWFYDQIGFSGANLQGAITATHPEAAGRSLRTHEILAGDDGTLAIPAGETLIAAFDRAPGAKGAWRRHEIDGVRAATASEGDELRIVTWRRTALDYLDPDAVALLIDVVHGEFERRVPQHVGSTIVGSFQDELPAMPTWSAGFADAFLDDTGYDLLAELPALWDFTQERSAVVRADYHRVRTTLAEAAFFRPLGEWHRARGMMIGADQTNPARAGAPTQSAQLYGDYFSTHRWFDAVGSDHEGDARVHSSMADLYDHPRVWIEAFHSSGWGGTLEDTWDWLIPFFFSGGNLYNPHASYYNLQAGWFEWAPPSTDFRQPYYEVYPQFATAVARVSAMLTWGQHLVDVGVLYPAPSIRPQLPPDLPIDHFFSGDIGEEYPGADAAQRSYMALVGKNDWFRADPGLLDRAGLDFDVIDGDSVVAGASDAGALRINGFDFRVVIVPEVSAIDPLVARRLGDLLDSGGRVICVGQAPAAPVAAIDDGASEVERLRTHPRLEIVETAEAAARALDTHPRFVSSPHGARVMRSGSTSVALLPSAFPNATAYPLRAQPGASTWTDIDVDPARYAESFEVRLPGPVGDVELWNPATGVTVPLAVRRIDGDTLVQIDNAGAPLLALVWTAESERSAEEDTAPSESAPPAERASGTPVDLSWVQSLVPTLDNRWGDFALPAGTPVPLEIWQLDRIDDEGREQPVRVTFGQELLVSAARPAGDLGDPLDVGDCARVLRGDDLGDPSWELQVYSATQGRDSSAGSSQNPKGFVEEEFFTFELPERGEVVGVRAVVRLPAAGHHELVVSSVCPVRAWVGGVEVDAVADGFDTVFPVVFADAVAVLELRFEGIPTPPGVTGYARARRTRASFAFARQGERVPRPEFMVAGALGVADGEAVFRREFELAEEAERITIVAGSPVALVVRIDGEVVAEQAKVEYYESGLGDLPRYFTHRLGALNAGRHLIEVVAAAASATTPVFVDLVATGPQGSTAVVSGRGWTVGPRHGAPDIDRVAGLDTTYARAAWRPHPLPAAHWLSGPPEVGVPGVPFETATGMRSVTERFRTLLPAGTQTVELSADPEEVVLHGEVLPTEGRIVRLAAPLTEPTVLTVAVAPRTFSRGGAVWEGPIVLRTADGAPAVFRDWATQGLAAWSGGVRYETVLPDAVGAVSIELGRVRGAVVVDIDGVRHDSAFCGPYVFRLDDLAAGPHTIAVTVYGTLAPRYASATQSTSFVPSQLRSGPSTPFVVRRLKGA